MQLIEVSEGLPNELTSLKKGKLPVFLAKTVESQKKISDFSEQELEMNISPNPKKHKTLSTHLKQFYRPLTLTLIKRPKDVKLFEKFNMYLLVKPFSLFEKSFELVKQNETTLDMKKMEKVFDYHVLNWGH